MEPVSFLSAWLISRACRPGSWSPISPSSSARGVKRRDRIDHKDVDCAGADQRIGNLERLLAGVGLRDQKVVELDAELPGVGGVERVLRVDEGADAAALLRLGDGVQRERRLAGRFRAVNLHDAAARKSADAERDVEAERAGRNGGDLHHLAVLPKPHDGALAEGPLDLGERGVERLRLVHSVPVFDDSQRRYHGIPQSTSEGGGLQPPVVATYPICSQRCQEQNRNFSRVARGSQLTRRAGFSPPARRVVLPVRTPLDRELDAIAASLLRPVERGVRLAEESVERIAGRAGWRRRRSP